jgi:hypothetical protein
MYNASAYKNFPLTGQRRTLKFSNEVEMKRSINADSATAAHAVPDVTS